MELAALIISAVALVLVILVGLAVIEVVGDGSKAEDGDEATITAIDLSEGTVGRRIQDFGLEPGPGPASMLLFLSPVCRTCRNIAERLGGTVPDGVTVVVAAADPERMRAWAVEHGLTDPRVRFDDDRSLVEGIGIEGSPTVVGIEDERIAFAAGVSNIEAFGQLYQQMTERVSGEFSAAAE